MSPQEVKAYNEKNNLAGKRDELLTVVDSRGRMQVMTRKNLQTVKGFREYEPNRPSPVITAPNLSDDVLKIEAERQRLAQKVAELEAKLNANTLNASDLSPIVAIPKRMGRPKGSRNKEKQTA